MLTTSDIDYVMTELNKREIASVVIDESHQLFYDENGRPCYDGLKLFDLS